MKILVLCGENATEWQLEFAQPLGRALHEHRCTCIVDTETSFVRELASSGIACLGYSLQYLHAAEPDAYILVGRSEGARGTLTNLSPLLMYNKGQARPNPFILVGWRITDAEHIASLFDIHAFLTPNDPPPTDTWFKKVLPNLPAATSVNLALRALGLGEIKPPS